MLRDRAFGLGKTNSKTALSKHIIKPINYYILFGSYQSCKEYKKFDDCKVNVNAL